MKKPETTIPSPLLWTIPQVAAPLNLGRTKVFELIAREGLPTVRFGTRSVRVSPEALRKWLEQREREGM